MKNFKKQTVRLLALLLVTAMLLLSLVSCKNISKVEVLRSENFSVSAAMLTYSLYDSYYYYLNYFGEEMMKLYFGIDSSISLQKQYSDEEKGITWFDVFKTEALDGFKNALALCEAAKAEGVELSENDHKYIQSEIDEIEELATKNGVKLKKYIQNLYGKGITEDDIKKSLEIYRLANKMRFKDYYSTTVSDSEIQAVVDKEGDTYLMRDILYCELTLSNDSAKNEKIKEYAEKIVATSTEADFRAMITEFLNSEYCVNVEKEASKAILTESVQNNISEDEKNELDSWAFASATVVGSTYLRKESSYYMVYMAVTEPAKDETPSRNMHTIVFEPSVYGTMDACKAKAEEVYASWKQDGESMEKFKSLVELYSTDYESVCSGGYYENVKKGDMVDELDKWLFAEDLEIGASTLIKSDFGYHIMIYSGVGEPAWMVSVINGIREDKNATNILNYIEEYTVTEVSGNMKYVKAK